MPSLEYPAALPKPSVAPLTPFERRRLTSLPGARFSSVTQRDFGGVQQLQWNAVTTEELSSLLQWFRDDLTQGAAWFAAEFPSPRGEVTGVYKFITHIGRTYLGASLWRLSAACEVRGIGELPQSEGFDEFFANVILLLGGDGVAGSTAIVDDSSYAHAPVVSTGVQITDAGEFFGTGQIESDTGSDLRYAGSDFWTPQEQFTLEFSLTVLSNSPSQFLFGRSGAAYMRVSDSGAGFFSFLTFNYFPSDNLAVDDLPLNVRHQIAITRDALGIARIFVGGEIAAESVNPVTQMVSVNPFYIVSAPGQQALIGYLDEVRFTQGVCRYSAAYAPATGPFPRG